MPKARVHELAKELGVTSKQVMQTLTDMGEFENHHRRQLKPPSSANFEMRY